MFQLFSNRFRCYLDFEWRSSSVNTPLNIGQLKGTCMLKINLLRKLAHTSFVADTKTLVRILKAPPQFCLDYKEVAYSSASQSLLTSLDMINCCTQTC